MRSNLKGTTFALLLAAAAGCTSPGLATTAWRDEAPTATPESRTRAATGTLTVATFASLRRDEVEADHRGFAVFHASGALVFESHGFAGATDAIRLAPGRYVVVSLTGDGFDRRLESRQALVAAGRETRVNFLHAPAAATAIANEP